jgi:hypothetical protein
MPGGVIHYRIASLACNMNRSGKPRDWHSLIFDTHTIKGGELMNHVTNRYRLVNKYSMLDDESNQIYGVDDEIPKNTKILIIRSDESV